MILNHIARCAYPVVIPGAPSQSDVLGHGDLDMVDIVRIPDGIEELIGEAQRKNVLDRLLAQVVIDAEDGVLREDPVHHRVEFLGALQIMTEGLLDDHAPPLLGVALGQPRT